MPQLFNSGWQSAWQWQEERPQELGEAVLLSCKLGGWNQSAPWKQTYTLTVNHPLSQSLSQTHLKHITHKHHSRERDRERERDPPAQRITAHTPMYRTFTRPQGLNRRDARKRMCPCTFLLRTLLFDTSGYRTVTRDVTPTLADCPAKTWTNMRRV